MLKELDLGVSIWKKRLIAAAIKFVIYYKNTICNTIFGFFLLEYLISWKKYSFDNLFNGSTKSRLF